MQTVGSFTAPPAGTSASLTRNADLDHTQMKIAPLLGLFCCLILLDTTALARDADYLPYSKFIAEVEAGSVKSVSLDRFSQISGTYTVDGNERTFQTYGDTGSANDILLTRLLEQKDVAVTLQEESDRPGFFGGASMFVTFVMLLVPIATLILAVRINSKVGHLNK